MAITVTFTFDEEAVAKLESLSLMKGEKKSSILRDLIGREFADMLMSKAVSAETVARDPAAMLKPEERAKIGV